MSTAPTSLSDTLPSSIPKLDASGMNWAIFAVRFQDAVEAKGFWGHFTGAKPRPTAVVPGTKAVTVPTAVPAEGEEAPAPVAAAPTTPVLTAEELAVAQKQWDKDELSAKSLLTQKIPDSTLMRIHAKKTVRERWEAIVSEYTEKGAYAQTDLRKEFLKSKCPVRSNVRTFLDDLRVKREELASVGVKISEDDYRSTVINSLPFSLANFASSQLAAAQLFSTSKTIAPDILISLISEEYERQKNQRNQDSGGKGKEVDEAMSVGSSSYKGKGNGNYGKKDEIVRGACWNCGEKGHLRFKCPKPKGYLDGQKKGGGSRSGGGGSGDSSKKATGSANAVMEGHGSDSDGVFAVNCESESEFNGSSSTIPTSIPAPSEHGSMPGLAPVSATDGEVEDVESEGEDDGWFSEVASDSGDFVDPGWESDEESEADEGLDTAPEVLNMFLHGEVADDIPRVEIFDSGTTRHISPYRDDFVTLSAITPKTLRAANKGSFSAVGVGELVIDVPNGVDINQLHLTEVLYSPEVGYTLVSIGRLDENGFSATFGGGKCVLRGPEGECIGQVPKNPKGLYRVEHEADSANAATEAITIDQFHRRMGHISPLIAKKLVDNKLVTGVRLAETLSGDPFFCESCVYAKATRKSVAKEREGNRAEDFGAEVHSDLWGPAPVATKGGKRYYVTFIDDKTRLTNLYFLAKKSDSFESYKDYEAWCDTQLGAKIKVLHSDRGGEYEGQEFILYLNSRGTERKRTVHDTPQHNGVAERRNRVIVERVRALLHASGLPKSLWGEAARHVVWLLNRTSTKAVEGNTPYEAAFGKKPDLSKVREWGEKVWVRVEKGSKLGGRVKEGRWMGVDDTSKGVRIYWPDKRNVTVERNVYYDKTGASASRFEGEDWDDFVETKVDELTGTSTTVPQSSTPAPNPEPTSRVREPPIMDDTASDAASEPEVRSKRVRKPTQRVKDLLEGRGVTSDLPKGPKVAPGVQLPTEEPSILEAMLAKLAPGYQEEDLPMAADFLEEYAMAAEISEAEALEPRTLAEAKSRPDWPLWEKAIAEELELLRKAGTWEVVDAPLNANIVGSKWVFRAKKDAAGNVVRYKARLVAQGFSQVPGVDYFDTFAPVARLASIRAVLAMAAVHDLELHQVDIKGAYLNGKLTNDEVIYMKQPPDYPAPNSKGQVCRLLKTLYGLKQSGRRWYQRLVEILVEFLGFLRCEVDQAVFYKRVGTSLIIVLVHVDDCTIVATALPLINDFKANLVNHVEITDLGELHWLLGIEIRRERERRLIFLSQRSYLDSILTRYGLQDLKPLSIPMDPNVRLTSMQSPSTTQDFARMRNVPYHEAVGSLMYAALGTRPDIAYAVQTVSRFTSKPGLDHWEAVKRIFRYLKGTRELWLAYGGNEKDLLGYADADGSMAEDRHAISGYAFILHGGAVSWSAKRQEIVSLSTTESEYVAATNAAKEALWLRSLLSQLFATDFEPTTLFSDNQSAIALTKDHQYHARTKHIDIRFHFIRWIVENGSLRLVYCPTNDMVADVLTKALPSPKVKHFAKELGLVSV